MPGKPKDKSSDAVMTFRLPRRLHQQLVEAAGGRSVSEEMRHRLEGSLAGGFMNADDPKTLRLLDAIALLARDITASYGPWHEDPQAFGAFVYASMALLSYARPQGELTPKPPKPGSPGDLVIGEKKDATPEDIARTFAAMAARAGGFI